MPFDKKKIDQPATILDLSLLNVNVRLAIGDITTLLNEIVDRDKPEVNARFKAIESVLEDMTKNFRQDTGWTDDE